VKGIQISLVDKMDKIQRDNNKFIKENKCELEQIILQMEEERREVQRSKN